MLTFCGCRIAGEGRREGGRGKARRRGGGITGEREGGEEQGGITEERGKQGIGGGERGTDIGK